jgi:sigma-B regulation protein RsbU (phosphoserine phosphatase)
MFITVFFAVIDFSKKTFTYSSAGHNPALLWNTSNRKFKSLGSEPPCLPVGVDQGGLFEKLLQEKKISLTSGDVVVLYTDGVTEAMNADRDEFGENGLQEFLAKQPAAADAQTLISALDKQLTEFCGEVPQNDDIAAIIVKID